LPLPANSLKAHKLSIIVQLLMGEIPERSAFKQPMLQKSLVPYFHITRGFFTILGMVWHANNFAPAVRVGDLAKFQEALAKYKDVFLADKTYTLILRYIAQMCI
jgi:26S proteasome regulatory subunit N3